MCTNVSSETSLQIETREEHEFRQTGQWILAAEDRLNMDASQGL